ncbi:hypothetical protein HD597_009644 [Nonomuraea thailandensis]|uniref:Uncharacterized protein n=1 Tax=Nonomuraea thailandensis TaxID=1188745 RepID=A0A9X2GNM2_9ACTN|nr:hypothetical protein [Nonomuraea thailandensis]MCP2362624.1 hypothetical protein [Nonomuraea thailandensis]
MTHLLHGLRCATCLTLNALWLDPLRGLVECSECGQTALIVTDPDEGRTA